MLFGRGGQTNLHIGNLRYRDIISIHRQDYVQASKGEKPLVARKIVKVCIYTIDLRFSWMDALLTTSLYSTLLFTPSPKAIRTGVNPGRFLRKGDDGKWQTVSDKVRKWNIKNTIRLTTIWLTIPNVGGSMEG